MLPPEDQAHLTDRAPDHVVQADAGMTCIIIRNFALGSGFDQSSSDLMLRLSPGYPDVPPDMWWFAPPVRRIDGATIPATEVVEQHFGRTWQRWSRHLNAGQWRSGIDGLHSYLALVTKELRAAAPAMAA